MENISVEKRKWRLNGNKDIKIHLTKISTLYSEDAKSKCWQTFYNVCYVLFSLNLSQTASGTHARTHIFSFKGADSLWLCCNNSYIAFPAISLLTSARIRINIIQGIIKEVKRQWAISTFRDDCVFLRDPSFLSCSGSHNSNKKKLTKT